jgi:hypothetical protein
MALATTWELPAGTSDQTAQLQSIFNSAVPGDTVNIDSGNHYFNGSVNQPIDHLTVNCNGQLLRTLSSSVPVLVLRGNYDIYNNIYIDGANQPQVLAQVYGSNLTFNGGTFRNSGTDTGLLLQSCNTSLFTGISAFYNHTCGISQSNCYNNAFVNCNLSNNGGEGLTIDNNSGYCTVQGCTISNNNGPNSNSHNGVGGIGMDDSSNININHCTINGNGLNGVCSQNNVGLCNNVVLDTNTIDNNQNWGVYRNLQKGPDQNWTFTNNTITGNGVDSIF